jgi:hypothetical protein
VHVFSRVCLDCDELKFLRDVLDSWMWRRQRVHGWCGAASRVYMRPWLFVFFDDNHCLRWCHRHLRRVWRRLQLRRERRPGGRVRRRRSGVLLWCWLESI